MSNQSEVNKNYDLFKKLLKNQTKFEKYSVLKELKGEKKLLEKISNDKKKKVGGGRKSRSDLSITKSNIKITDWTVDHVLSWVRLIDYGDDEKFINNLFEHNMHNINNLLSLKENSPFLNVLKNQHERKRFILNIMNLCDCLKNDSAPKKEFDTIIDKLLKKNGSHLVNIEVIFGVAQYLSDFYELKDVLISQQSEKIHVSLVIVDSFLEKEDLSDTLSVDVEFPDNVSQRPPFHTGILVGDWYFEWNNTSLIVPRIITNSSVLMSISLQEIEKETYTKYLDKIIYSIVKWNGKYNYTHKKHNSQCFVDLLIKHLNLNIYDRIVLQYIEKMKSCGICEVKDLPVLYFKEIDTWNTGDCYVWLRTIEYDNYLKSEFSKNKINGRALVSIKYECGWIEKAIKNDFLKQSFLVYLCHVKRNLNDRGISKFDDNFYLFAKKFLNQQAKNQGKIKTKMNFFDLEDIIFKFSNKEMLMSFFLTFERNDKIQIILVKKDPRTYHCGMLIGKVILEWKQSEIIVPKFYHREDHSKYFKIDIDSSVDNTFTTASIVANIIIKYNSYYSYAKQRGERVRNCMDFVDDVLTGLDLATIVNELPKHAEKYLDKIRRQGRNDMPPASGVSWKISSQKRTKSSMY